MKIKPRVFRFTTKHTPHIALAATARPTAKAIDVIDFIMYMENITKHEAILKAQEMLNVVKSRSAGITGSTGTTTTTAKPMKQQESR